jgi:sec-independent protein translocase protein TatA
VGESAAMPGLGISEIVLIAIVVLLLFGSKELPKIIRSIVKSWRDLQNAANNVKKEVTSIMDDDDDLLG